MAQVNCGPNEAEQDRDFKIALMSLHENTRSKFYLFEVRKSGRNRSTRICTSRSRGGMRKKGLNKKQRTRESSLRSQPQRWRYALLIQHDGCGPRRSTGAAAPECTRSDFFSSYRTLYGSNEAEQNRDFKSTLTSPNENARSKFYSFEVRSGGCCGSPEALLGGGTPVSPGGHF